MALSSCNPAAAFGKPAGYIMKTPESIKTGHLILRKPKLEAAEAIFKGYACDPRVTRYLIWRLHRTIGETIEFLQTWLENWKEVSSFDWAIAEKGGGRCIGMVSIRISGFKEGLGYVLGRSSWGRGIMTAAAGVVIGWAIS